MRAEHAATLLSVGVESRVFAVSSSTSGLLLSPPPSHSETCMPTVCTRNFLGKPSSNLHAVLFPALRGKGFSTPAWHALSEDPVGDWCCWDRAWEKDTAEKAKGLLTGLGRSMTAREGPVHLRLLRVECRLLSSKSDIRLGNEKTSLMNKHHISPPDTRQLAWFSVMSSWPWPTMCYFHTVHIRDATNARIDECSPTPTDIKLKGEAENPHIVQAGTGHIVLVDYKNRLINDEKNNCLFFQPLGFRTSLCLLLTVISHEFPVCSLATLDYFPYWLWNYVIIQIASMMASQACPQIVYRSHLMFPF